jgi:hypothetical protein
MKYTMINFLLFILMMNYLNKSLCSHDIDTVDTHKLIQCKLCQEMFKFNFNFDEMLKSKKIENIKKVFDSLQVHPDELNGYFSKDNLDFVLKEISMQYFFKGGDSLPDESQNLKLKQCKDKNTSDDCEKIKLQICQKVLSFEDGVCVDMKSHLKNLMMKASINKSEIIGLKEKENKLTFKNQIQENLKKHDNEGILNFQKYQFKQRDKDPDVVKQFGDISLLELSPEYIKNNFDSTPKSHWKPPKPVLLQNFERNIGDQLKDISSLAR